VKKQLKIIGLQQEVLELSKAGRTIPVGFLVPKIIDCLGDYKDFQCFQYTQEYLEYIYNHKDHIISALIGKLQTIHSKKIELSERDWEREMQDAVDIVFWMKQHDLESLTQEI